MLSFYQHTKHLTRENLTPTEQHTRISKQGDVLNSNNYNGITYAHKGNKKFEPNGECLLRHLPVVIFFFQYVQIQLTISVLPFHSSNYFPLIFRSISIATDFFIFLFFIIHLRGLLKYSFYGSKFHVKSQKIMKHAHSSV